MTKKQAADSIFILITASLCHLLFSRYGFNPTDEGFVLSATNRVLHGLVPHVDFSSVRPLGYAYLHIPELLISKNYVFLISRFVFWLEQVIIAFLWIRFILKYTKKEIALANKYMLVLVTFIFNVHYFPCSVLHTIDGLLMCMIGLNIIISEKKYAFIGFFFIGFAALCKQNYLVVLPFAILLFGRKKIVLNAIVGLLPIALYVSIISVFGGFIDLKIQLTGHNELWQVGIKNYVLNYYFLIGIALAFLSKKIRIPADLYAYALCIALLILLVTDHYHGKLGFFLFGVILVELFGNSAEINFRKPVIIAIILAWCVSISVGYNTPALFLGSVFTLIIIKLTHEKLAVVFKWNYGLILIILIIFCVIRETNLYRDKKINDCDYNLDGIVDGACGIRTNLNTYKVLVELNLLKKKHPKIIVVPDFTACNILHSQESKILTEWPNKTEIPNEKILQKVTSKFGNDTSLLFAVAKFQTALLKDSLTPYPNNGMDYPILKFIDSKTKFVEDYNYFTIRK
jgi:hypothetical protein